VLAAVASVRVIGRGLLIGGAAFAFGLAGCGGEDAARRPAPRPVKLSISSPDDTAVVRGRMLEVRGVVSPATARVRVLGRPAAVSGGSFSAVVPIEQGANVVDVAATAPGRATALAAFRVTRDERVTVPALAGTVLQDVEDQLGGLGLEVESERGGGLFDSLLPGDPVVCEQKPAAGTRVRRGTTVRVVVAKSC
jgi:Glucodextranase, domain B/PASTA domain